MLRPLTSTLFPYTTLFRSNTYFTMAFRLSVSSSTSKLFRVGNSLFSTKSIKSSPVSAFPSFSSTAQFLHRHSSGIIDSKSRSEEHTSELQSRGHLVCRLLLDAPTSDIYSLSLHDALPI